MNSSFKIMAYLLLSVLIIAFVVIFVHFNRHSSNVPDYNDIAKYKPKERVKILASIANNENYDPICRSNALSAMIDILRSTKHMQIKRKEKDEIIKILLNVVNKKVNYAPVHFKASTALSLLTNIPFPLDLSASKHSAYWEKQIKEYLKVR